MTDEALLQGLRATRNDESAQWRQNGVLMCSAPASWFDAVIASMERPSGLCPCHNNRPTHTPTIHGPPEFT